MNAKKTPKYHDVVQKIMENDFYANQVKKFTNETFVTIITDRKKAVELAEKAITEFEPSNLNSDYIELVTDAMQELSQEVMKERALKVRTKNKTAIN